MICRDLVGLNLAPKRRDFDDLGPELDVSEPETAADDPAVSKETLDLVRMRGRTDVEVFRPAAEEQIADAATNQVGDMAGLVQAIKNRECVGVDVLTRERVLIARHDSRLDHRPGIVPKPFIAGHK